MDSQQRFFIKASQVISDGLAIIGAWLAAYYLRFYTVLDSPLGIPEPWLYFKLIPFIAVIWLLTASVIELYGRRSLVLTPFLQGLKLIQAAIIITLGLIAFTYFYEEYRYSRITLAIFSMLQVILLISGRSLTRKILRRRRRHLTPIDVLVIAKGEGLELGCQVATRSRLLAKRVAGLVIPGASPEDLDRAAKLNLPVLDAPGLDLPVEGSAGGSAGGSARGSAQVSTNAGWGAFFNQYDSIRSVVVALPSSEHGFIDSHFAEIADQIADIQVIPDILRFTRFSPGVDIIEGVPLITLHDSPLSGRGRLVKRSMDIAVSALGLILLAPLLALLALLVKLSSPGPVLYRQERMGLDGSKFPCLKFRSMPVNAEQATGAVWAKKGENRATPLGAFLRRSSLDELPQLWNVLVGEMSLVGPRPERPVFVSSFRSEIPGYMLRHKVKAGITGWAQVNGYRGDTSLEGRIAYDLFYIRNWSLWLDLRILMMTIHEVWASKNAY